MPPISMRLSARSRLDQAAIAKRPGDPTVSRGIETRNSIRHVQTS
jgi:hypothetical protein